MGRIRTIKPELFKHEELFDLERDTGLPIRVAFMGLFTACDREGRFKWRPRTLKLDVLPHDDVDFARVLDALGTRGFIVKYAIEGKEYGAIPTWHLHQVINNRESESDIPAPTENSLISVTSTCERRVGHSSVTPLVHAPVEGKGKEGKGTGKEEEGNNPLVELPPDAPKKSDLIADIFAYWQKCMGSPGSQMDAKRKGAIEKALKTYTPRQICEAILGCSRTPHNMGQNDQKTKYNGLTLILRDADQIERFIRAAHVTPKAAKGSETIEQTNARVLAELGMGAPADNDGMIFDMEDLQDESR